MRFITAPSELRSLTDELRSQSRTIGLVPTMGNLHAGHMRLVEEAKRKCDFVVSTIFVNPLQFGPSEDLDAYPRTLEADKQLLMEHHCDALFAPSVEQIFGGLPTQQTSIHVPVLTDRFCGASRPGHFDGVATIVCKLFHLANPHIAFFGLKDYQQYLVICKMASDLAMPIEIVGIETVREASGLAMSSRNSYLSAEQKKSAANIYACLRQTGDALESGDKNFAALEEAAKQSLQAAGLRPDYFAICNADNLQPPTADDATLVILAAAYVGAGRLIDNLRVTVV